MRGGSRDGLYTTLTTVGLALAMLAWLASGVVAWVFRLSGLVLITVSAVALLVGVVRQRRQK